jgi:hypothetical protein
MLEAVVVVGVLLALAVGGFISYGSITENAIKAKVKAAASDVHTGVVVASIDGDPNTQPQSVIDAWNASTDKIRVVILEPASGGTNVDEDFCISATNTENPSITAREGFCLNVTAGSSSDDSASNDGNTGGAENDGYTSDGAVPVGYTWGIDFAACPIPFAVALKTRILADTSQTFFDAVYLNSIGDYAGSNTAWTQYGVLNEIANAAYGALTPFEQRSFNNLDGYLGFSSDVPGYRDTVNDFWADPTQVNFNQMHEMIATVIPDWCGAVTAGTATIQCHPETQTFLVAANNYYHNYMYEEQRYTAVGSAANYDAWVAKPTTAQSDQANAAKDSAYNAMIASVGSDYELSMAQNMHREELNASWNTFSADTSRSNFGAWVDYEFPINACR